MSEKVLIIKNAGTWLTADELKELAELLENQNTTDRLSEGNYDIDGNYADFFIQVNSDGDIIYA